MSERPEEEIKWLKLFLYHRDNAKNISKTLLDYITQLEAELEKAKAENERLLKIYVGKGIGEPWYERVGEWKADSERLEKLLDEGVYIDVRLFGKIGPFCSREDVDKLDELLGVLDYVHWGKWWKIADKEGWQEAMRRLKREEPE